MKTILVDLSDICAQSFHGATKNMDPEKVPADFDGHVFYFRKKMMQTLQDLIPAEDIARRNYKVLYAVDHVPDWKKELLPEYKANRVKKVSSCSPTAAVKRYLATRPAIKIWCRGEEADDVIASYIAQNATEDICITTRDSDLWQLADNPKVLIYNAMERSKVVKYDLERKFGIPEFRHLKLHKALMGDSSDNIPNALPFQKKHLLPIIAQTDGTLEDFKDKIKDLKITPKFWERWKAGKAQAEVNYKIVTLRYDLDLLQERF